MDVQIQNKAFLATIFAFRAPDTLQNGIPRSLPDDGEARADGSRPPRGVDTDFGAAAHVNRRIPATLRLGPSTRDTR